MPENRPNILILMTDQQRADCLSSACHPQIRTPNMDRIAAEGMRFTHACTVCPICMPARASFISGRYVHNHNMWTNKGELPANDESLFHHLQHAGYYTGHVGKSHYYEHGIPHMRDREDYMHARGFDYVHETTGPWATVDTDSYMTDDWQRKGLLDAFRNDYNKRRAYRPKVAVWPSPLPTEDFLDSYIGRQAVRFIEQYERDQPFALFVGFGGPHEPFDAPGDYATMYDPADAPPHIEPAEPGDRVPPHAAEWQRHDRHDAMTVDDIRRLRANYYGKITLVDDWFGRIFDACRNKGFMDDLVIVFWSDHGEMAGDHQLLYKSRFFESALRVPLMVRWPGRVTPGATSSALAETVDIMPTLLEGLALDPSYRCTGRSLWPVLRDPNATVRDAAFSEILHSGRRNFMVRTDRHKYAVHEDGQGYMLYDLIEDPTERSNLIGQADARHIEADLRDRLLQFLCRSQYAMR